MSLQGRTRIRRIPWHPQSLSTSNQLMKVCTSYPLDLPTWLFDLVLRFVLAFVDPGEAVRKEKFRAWTGTLLKRFGLEKKDWFVELFVIVIELNLWWEMSNRCLFNNNIFWTYLWLFVYVYLSTGYSKNNGLPPWSKEQQKGAYKKATKEGSLIPSYRVKVHGIYKGGRC